MENKNEPNNQVIVFQFLNVMYIQTHAGTQTQIALVECKPAVKIRISNLEGI